MMRNVLNGIICLAIATLGGCGQCCDGDENCCGDDVVVAIQDTKDSEPCCPDHDVAEPSSVAGLGDVVAGIPEEEADLEAMSVTELGKLVGLKLTGDPAKDKDVVVAELTKSHAALTTAGDEYAKLMGKKKKDAKASKAVKALDDTRAKHRKRTEVLYQIVNQLKAAKAR